MSGLRALAAAVGLSAAGDLLAFVTLALVVHDLTGSGPWVSAYFATTTVPAVACARTAGTLADRCDPARVIALATVAQSALALALALTTDSLAAVLALSALLAAAGAIALPAEFRLVNALAASDLARGNGLVEAARSAGFAAGPALAALIAAGAGAQAALLADAASFAVIAAVAWRLRRLRRVRPDAAATAPRMGAAGAPAPARGGVALLWLDPVLRPALTAAVGALAFISASLTIDVFYAKDVLGAGDAGYALMIAAWTAGMVAGATALARRAAGRRAPAAAALAALGLQGAGVAVTTAWPVLAFALACYALGGVGHGVKNTLLRVLIAQRTPEQAHGRAFAAYAAARNAAELGALALGGVLVTGLGARDALLVAGVGPLLAALAGLAWLRAATARAPAAAPGAA